MYSKPIPRAIIVYSSSIGKYQKDDKHTIKSHAILYRINQPSWVDGLALFHCSKPDILSPNPFNLVPDECVILYDSAVMPACNSEHWDILIRDSIHNCTGCLLHLDWMVHNLIPRFGCFQCSLDVHAHTHIHHRHRGKPTHFLVVAAKTKKETF